MKRSRMMDYLLRLTLFAFLLAACERPDPEVTILSTGGLTAVPPTLAAISFEQLGVAPPEAAAPIVPLAATVVDAPTPTPDPPRYDPHSVGGQQTHTISPGDTLNYLGQFYGVSPEEIAALNQIQLTDILYIGQQLLIPGQASQVGPSFKIIPDSELLFGPAAKGFYVRQTAVPHNGFLLRYSEEVEGKRLEGPEIVELVAHRHSVNPRLLLALLEYRSGWLTQPTLSESQQKYPFGKSGAAYEGLYRQLSWAANELNWGYYGRAEGNLHTFALPDKTRITFAPDINDATAGVQRMLGGADTITFENWLHDAGPTGFFATYERLFGNPFALAIEPVWPSTLAQPTLQLPWANGETWYFTGGPHGGWNSGSAWAALDFAPEADVLGCFDSDAWVTAMSDGIVTRSGFGAVVVDLDGDRYAGTGWAIIYMHLADRDRIPTGSPVQTGDRLGHPSCEGGFSDGTHVHIARTYNGRWVSADGDPTRGGVPFNMGGWVSQGVGREYDGFLIRGAVSKEACACREASNAITWE
ncbi:MAG: LysM peptidoglycan-binding domain-containing protein [Chloroflexi bacterium]|nr:LysM peptidoglycan-binding domain-containing protein [Chloroflexota bacterium]